jgi:hypothetical protein
MAAAPLLLLVVLLAAGRLEAQQPQQDIEVLSHICKYGVHPGGRR